MGKVSYDVNTNGYFEFVGGISRVPGDYRYVELDSTSKSRAFRSHKNADAIKWAVNLFENFKNGNK